MFTDQLFTDITIKVQEKEILAHKCILSSRSEVFQKMLLSQMKESTGVIEIIDIDYDTVYELIHFLYSGEAKEISSSPEKLFSAADKYHITRLRSICEFTLIQTINTTNVFRRLVLAHRHIATNLHDSCVTFISKHAHVLCETEDFQRLSREHPALLAELYITLSSFLYCNPSRKRKHPSTSE